MKIKICGLFREEDIRYANCVRPDYVGFVFFQKSRRNVSFEQAAYLKNLLDPGIKAVGVFVDEPEENVICCLNEGILDLAQLHGQESEETVRKIRLASGKPVIKSVRVTCRRDAEAWLGSEADYLLFDNGKGTGKCFDWEELGEIGRDFFLAGGITTDNVRDAMERFSPYCIDVSSGAETDGVKDFEKMKALVEAVHGFEQKRPNGGIK